jgi:hypothetical protein
LRELISTPAEVGRGGGFPSSPLCVIEANFHNLILKLHLVHWNRDSLIIGINITRNTRSYNEITFPMILFGDSIKITIFCNYNLIIFCLNFLKYPLFKNSLLKVFLFFLGKVSMGWFSNYNQML